MKIKNLNLKWPSKLRRAQLQLYAIWICGIMLISVGVHSFTLSLGISMVLSFICTGVMQIMDAVMSIPDPSMTLIINGKLITLSPTPDPTEKSNDDAKIH